MLTDTVAKVIYNEPLKAVEIIWVDFATTEQYKQILEYALILIQEHHCSLWISDMTNGKAVTKESFYWLKSKFIARASSSGIKKCGFLVTGNTFRKLYAESLRGTIYNWGGEMQYFNDRTALETWLTMTL